MGLFAEIAYGPSPSFVLGNVATGTPVAVGTRSYQIAFNLASGIAGLSAPVTIQSPGTGPIGVTINNAFVPATATGFQVYRTTNGGGSYFQITGSPFALSLAGTQIVDSTSDATLATNPAQPANVVYGGLISMTRLAQLTNADNAPNAGTPNYSVLQSVVWEAQAYFYSETGVPYDDTTPSGPPPSVPTNQPNPQFPPLGGNVCHQVGVALVIALLYDWRGQPQPALELQAAWNEARRRLDRWKTQFGNLRWAAPGTDSRFTPSEGCGLPDFDRARLQRSVPNDPQPYPSVQVPSQSWGPGDF